MKTEIDAVETARWRAEYDAALRDHAPGDHPAEEDWVRYAEGDMDAEGLSRLADHVTTCAMCADIWRAVEDLRTGAAELVAPGSGRRTWWWAAAAAAVLAVAGGLLVRNGRDVAMGADTVPAPAAVATPAATPERRVPTGVRAWAAMPAAPAVSLPASLTLTVRGGPTDHPAFLTAFGAAIAPYRDGRYEDAAAALDAVTRRFPAIPEGWFYLGASRLLAGDAAGAIAPLQRARGSETAAGEARWLEAVALERAGRTSDADTALRAMCDGRGPERARACEAADRPR